MPCQNHSHSRDARTNATIIRYLITKDRAGRGIHDEPDVCFYTTDFDVGFIGSLDSSRFIIVVVDEWLDTDSGGLAVVGYLLVGNGDVIQIPQCLSGFSKGQPKVDAQGKAQ